MAGISCSCEAIAGADMATRDSLLAKANAKNLPLGGPSGAVAARGYAGLSKTCELELIMSMTMVYNGGDGGGDELASFIL